MPVSRFMAACIIAMSLLAGCSGPEFIISFEKINGLQKGAPVIFEEITIGEVKKIAYEASGRFLVTVAIQDDFSSAVTAKSRFVISPLPKDSVGKAIVVTLEEKGGVPLKSGATIQGAAPSALDDVKPFFDRMEKGFDEFINNLRGIPESDQYRNFEAKLNELKKEMQDSSQAVQDEIRTRILPRLKEEADKLKKALEDLGREKDAESLEQQMNTLQDI